MPGSVGAHKLIARIRNVTARISDHRGDDSGSLSEGLFDAPEAARRKRCIGNVGWCSAVMLRERHPRFRIDRRRNGAMLIVNRRIPAVGGAKGDENGDGQDNGCGAHVANYASPLSTVPDERL
jgi:hypothetical protein